MLHRLSLLSLILLALLLPFELESPWLHLGPLVLTNVELALWLVLGLTFLFWWRSGRQVPPIPRAWRWLGFLFLFSLFLAAALAPDFQGNALKAALRTAAGLALALAVAVRVNGARERRWLALGLVGGGMLAAMLGLMEIAAGVDFVWLNRFRPGPTVAGPFLRLSGPFDYANQAAMFIEGTLPLLLALGWQVWRRGRRSLALLAAGALVLYAQAAIFTFSRASFATLLLVNLALALWLWRGQSRRNALLFGGAALLLATLVAGNLLLNSVFRLRLSGEGDSEWYHARFQVPAELQFKAGEERVVTVTVTNETVFTWYSAGSTPINLAARWVQPESGRQLAQHPRWPLAHPVPPGESITLLVPLRAPRTGGQYHLLWDMVQENVIWFSTKTGQETSSAVTVVGNARDLNGEEAAAGAEGVESFEAAWGEPVPVPGRRTLWAAALALWREHPWMGVGLDNFRLMYGRPLAYPAWNTTVHTNNWYLEMVVSLGLLGSLPFLLWLALLAVDMAQTTSRPGVTVWHLAIAAGLLAYLIHGLLDYFLLFNATGLLFWMLVGCWLAIRRRKGGPAETRS